MEVWVQQQVYIPNKGFTLSTWEVAIQTLQYSYEKTLYINAESS